MRRKIVLLLPILLTLAAVGSFLAFVMTHDIALLNPAGTIARQQRDLLVYTTLLSMVVVLPVFALTFFIVWRYRENGGSKKATYKPDWDNSRMLETIWWGLPCLIIIALATVAWRTSHSLDPYKPLASNGESVTVQVIALPWKWLFIYPDERIATVNHFAIPEDTPVNFEITADAPMNSFWIPQLGGQVYAMSGMKTKLHLSADRPGSYRGVSANLSGDGFAGMDFTVRAMTRGNYDHWLEKSRSATRVLTATEYDWLATPSSHIKPMTFAADKQTDIFNAAVMKYMSPQPPKSTDAHPAAQMHMEEM